MVRNYNNIIIFYWRASKQIYGKASLINLENKLANIRFLLIEKKRAISFEKRLYYNSEGINVLTIQDKSQEKHWNENCLFNRGWAGISYKVDKVYKVGSSVLNIIWNLQRNITLVRYIQDFIAYKYYIDVFKLVFITILIESWTI